MRLADKGHREDRERPQASYDSQASQLARLGRIDQGSPRRIPWQDFERNQRLMADNANRMSNVTRGSIRHGEALLVGMLRCARCAKKSESLIQRQRIAATLRVSRHSRSTH